MKKTIKLDYGKTGLTVSLENADVIEPRKQRAVKDPAERIRQKLREPDFGKGMADLENQMTVAVAHTDITRATPNRTILPVILEELRRAGIKDENIVLINMTGSHRAQTEKELKQMLGRSIVANYRCVQHNSFQKEGLTLAGCIGEDPLYINKDFMAADFRICTGFIEPHFFAGFSGGPKAVLPGLCDIDSIMRNHNAQRIGDDKADWGVTDGNPVWEHMREGCRKVNPDFLVNVAMNTHGEISGVFAGEWEQTHKKGCAFVRENAMSRVDKLYDIVITSNSGYPLDMNIYQCVKGMSCAAQIVKENGTIIVAAECAEGLPDNSHYHNLLKTAFSPEKLFRSIMESKKTLPEQWQVQIQTRIQKKAEVYLYSDSLTNKQIQEALLFPCGDIEALVRQKGGSVAVLPKGPQTIPCFTGR